MIRVSGNGCTNCGDCRDPGLYLRISERDWLCSTCWHKQGQPSPLRTGLSPAQIQEREYATIRRMLARGGTDRHLARSGKA